MQNTIINTQKSDELYETAKELIPGGVNSPVRSFKAVDRNPLFISKANGAYIWDADGNKYIDLVNSWGALIHGHRPPSVLKAIEKALESGISFGASHEQEVELAKKIISAMPSIEKIRLVNSGTEAVMTAIRLARASTGRNKIIKFEGCYHGHCDSVLSKSGSGLATLGIPSSAGVTKNTAYETLTLPYNDLHTLEITFSKFPNEIAGIIIEPLIGNSGVIKPVNGFLDLIRELCNKYKSVLIFDEVMTGFRLSYGGAQGKYNVKPDLTTLGKIIGGGMPIGAIGGKKELIDLLSPNGPVYQAGTMSGNPISVACGLSTLNLIDESQTYKKLEDTTSSICKDIDLINEEKGLKIRTSYEGSMFSIFFTDGMISNYGNVKNSNTKKYAQFFNLMLNQGIYLAPSQFEANFISTVISDQDIKSIVNAYKNAVDEIFTSVN